MNAITQPYNLNSLFTPNVCGLTFQGGPGSYRTEAPTAIHMLPDDMLRINTIDGVAHTQRRWYSRIQVDYEDDTPSRILDFPEAELNVWTPYISLLPQGVKRIIGGITGVFQAEGSMWFHYGQMIGLSEYDDIGKGLSDYDAFTWTNSQNCAYWWRDEPAY